MPLSPAPNLIEASDFSAGWLPDLEVSAVPPNGLLSALNLLPDIGSGTPEVRKGYKRISADLDSGYKVESLFAYNRARGTTQGNYVIVVLGSTGTDAVANNVKVYSVDLSTEVATLISPTNHAFASGDGRHWGETITGTFYGGSLKDPMYSWNPDDGWVTDASDQSGFPELVDSQNPAGGEIANDYAFKLNHKVLYEDPIPVTTAAYTAHKSNRFKKWKLKTEYTKGEKVSVKVQPAGEGNYMRSYRCIKKHTADAAKKPGVGADQATYWKKLELSLPRDEESEVTPDWDILPKAGVSNVAEWHGERLWIRYDNVGTVGKTRLQFSAPSKLKKGSDISEVQWDPTQFNVTPDEEGEGGGWLPDQTEPITALWSYGYYLLVFMRGKTKVLAGTNSNSWIFRDLAPVGAISPRAVCEHEGFVYFVSDRGFYRTDGTQVVEVEGAEHIRDWLRDAVNWEVAGDPNDITLFSHAGFVWMALPTEVSRQPDTVLAYDPATKSFWPLDLPVQSAVVNRQDGVDQLFFSLPTETGTWSAATYAWLGTEHQSKSTRTIAGPTILTNHCTNPSFENFVIRTDLLAKPVIQNPPTNWARTTPTKVAWTAATDAKRKGLAGLRFKNKRAAGNGFEGVVNSTTDEDATSHTISCYVRKTNWTKYPKVSYAHVRAYVDGELASGVHTFTKIGRGWWRVSATYTGSVSARNHGFVIKEGLEVDMDMVQVTKGALTDYFDGDGGTSSLGGVEGGTKPYVFQYDHPDVHDEPVDDAATTDPAEIKDIAWAFRPAWFPFGVLREERRIRRVWALVRGLSQVLLRAFRNYSDEAEFETSITPTDAESATHLEGLSMPDAYAVNVEAQGIGAPTAVLGVALDTQPRRIRYHN